MKKIEIHLHPSRQQYQIHIGYDILDRIAMMINEMRIASRYVIVTDHNVSALYGQTLLPHLRNIGVSADLISFQAGESAKKIESVLDITNALLDLGVDRKSALIALGGGVTGDLTGFISAIYMRGIPCIQVPTTLMAQVDSSIGGKTAINLPQGKNLLGTFSQPSAVFIDIKCLSTLPEAEYRNGLAEVIKYGVIHSEEFFQKLELQRDEIQQQNRDILEEVVQTACAIKSAVVEADEREQGQRRILNFGHTLGHAFEGASRYSLSHGNAVAIGMLAAARISQKVCGLSAEDTQRIEQLITSIGLAHRIPQGLDAEDILSILQRDKKKDGKTINFVLLKKIGETLVSGDVSDSLLRETIEGLRI